MKKLVLIAIVLTSAFLMFSCGGKPKMDGKTFNTLTIKAFTEANAALDKLDSKITSGIKTKDFMSIEIAADMAEKEVQVQIEKMKAMNPPDEGKEYKEAVLKSLESLKDIVQTGKKYADLKDGYTASEFNTLENEYNGKRTQLSNDLIGVSKIQEDFIKTIQ